MQETAQTAMHCEYQRPGSTVAYPEISAGHPGSSGTAAQETIEHHGWRVDSTKAQLVLQVATPPLQRGSDHFLLEQDLIYRL